MTHGLLSGIVTAVLMLAFIAITVWAWSGKSRRGFEEAARLPLRDDETASREARR